MKGHNVRLRPQSVEGGRGNMVEKWLKNTYLDHSHGSAGCRIKASQWHLGADSVGKGTLFASVRLKLDP